ncbi:MAG: DUF2007 domain-containing protein [Actinomycetota bacterium]|nr:DUF2007 domain-containing protein [Actinomycetota bacterium]
MTTMLAGRPVGGTGSLPPARDAGDEGGGGGSGWVRLLTAANDIEAHLVAGRLSEAGVEVRVVKDRSAPGAWLYGGSNPWAPATVMVRQRQLVDARMVMAEVSFEGPAAESKGIEPNVTGFRRPVVVWSLALGLGVLLTSLALARTADAVDRCDLPLLCGDYVTSP